MISIIIAVVILGIIALFLLALACIPLLFAYGYTLEENAKQDIKDALTIARTNKVLADQEVLESRRAKLDSEVAILELRIEEKRRNLGIDQDFHPTNY